MEKGFLARESARAPPAIRRSDHAREGESEGRIRGAPSPSDDTEDVLLGLSQENIAFFDHEGFEPECETAPRARQARIPDSRCFPELDELLREESLAKRPRKAPSSSPSPSTSMFRTLLLETELQSNVPSAPKRVRMTKKTDRPRMKIQRNTNKEKSTENLRQASLTKYLPVRKNQRLQKSVGDGVCETEAQPSLLFPGLITAVAEPAAEAAEISRVENPEPPLPDGFVHTIRLEPVEERLLVRFKYMFDSAVKKLSHIPPFPVGVQPFLSSMLEVQLDSTTSHNEHQILQQAIYSGQGAVNVYTGESPKVAPGTPEWARLPTSLPGTFLKKLAEFLQNRSILIVMPGASLNNLRRLSERLRSLGIPTRYTSETIPSGRVGNRETWLVNYDRCTEVEPRLCFDGVILPQGAEKWSGLPCGSLDIEMDPEFSSLVPVRTAFVDHRLGELIRRLQRTKGLEIDSRQLNAHGVDLCSGDFGVIFSHENPTGVLDEERFPHLIRRVLRAASFFRFVAVLHVGRNGSLVRLKQTIEVVATNGIQSDCQVQVVHVSGSVVEDKILQLCEMKGDDLADFAFLTLRNSPLAHVIGEGNSDQTPHASLISTLL